MWIFGKYSQLWRLGTSLLLVWRLRSKFYSKSAWSNIYNVSTYLCMMAASLLGTVDLSAFLQVLALWVQWAPCQGFAWAFPEVPRILVNRKCHEIHRMKVKDHRQFIRFMEDTRLFISVFHVFVPSAGFCSLIPGYVKLWTSWNWTTTPQDIVTNQTPLDGLRLCPVLYDIFISMFFGFGGGHFAGLPHVFFFFSCI